MSEYLGVEVSIPPNDPDHLGFLQEAGKGRLAMQQCGDCKKLRYPPGPACPLCQSLDWQWHEVSGKGAIYSYEVVVHAIHPAYRDRAPYIVALVELDEQRGEPTEDDALRIITSLVDADGAPVSEEACAIGLRVEVEFADLGDGLALPRFRLSDEDPEHEPWSFPGK